MKKKQLLRGGLAGAALTAPLIGLMYLANQLLDLAFAPYDVFGWMTRMLPGPVITFGLDMMIDIMRLLGLNVANTGKIAEQAMAIMQFWVLGILAGAAFYFVLQLRSIKPAIITGLISGALFGFPAIAISIGFGGSTVNPIWNLLWFFALYFIWGVILIRVYARLLYYDAIPMTDEIESEEKREAFKLNRRQFLVLMGSEAAAVTVVGAGIGKWLANGKAAVVGEGMAHQVEESIGNLFPNFDDMVIPAPGTRPEYTPIKNHFQVFIGLEEEEIDGEIWKLPVTGLVDTPLMLSLDDIKEKYPVRDQYVTLSCISGRVGTTLIATTQWTGASVKDVLADVGVQSTASYMNIISADGFYETVPLELIDSDERIMFCYAWDGNTLPVGHGFPLRIWIPDRYGMKQPKWITGIEITDVYKEGYWVERGWSELAQVRSTSVIDTVAVEHIMEKDGQKFVPVGGIAFAGARGISKVEVRVDGGSWEEALLRAPLSETTWVIWRYEWSFQAGTHLFEVRSFDNDGVLQELETQSSRPHGASGIHSLEKTING
ncbi:MAG: molybdopterin-dependent oxidoreductase [Anaerolineaceae bacterium]|nr:molybdopterin-dependent oxidoreductase [Anaerolineaceae bacterium]